MVKKYSQLSCKSISLECKECFLKSDINSPAQFVKACEVGSIASRLTLSFCECDICETPQCGERYSAHYIDKYGDTEHLEVCQECITRLRNEVCQKKQ